MTDGYLPDQDGPAGDAEEQEEIKAPFSFRLMVALTIVYLGWRLIQGIVWLVDRLS